MFPQPNIPGKEFGSQELVPSFMSLSALSGPYLSSSSTNLLDSSEIEAFLQDLVRRFEPEGDLDGVLGPVVVKLCCHESLNVGFASADGWRGVISGLEALVSVKAIANMITRLPEWNPDVPAPEFEVKSLMGRLLRLGVFHREWVCVPCTTGSQGVAHLLSCSHPSRARISRIMKRDRKARLAPR